MDRKDSGPVRISPIEVFSDGPTKTFQQRYRHIVLMRYAGLFAVFSIFFLDLKWIRPPYAYIVKDFLVLALILLLLKSFANTVGVLLRREWIIILRRNLLGKTTKKGHIVRRWPMIQTFFTSIAVGLLGFWLSRWSSSDMDLPLDPGNPTSDRYRTLLHAGLLVSLVSISMSMRRVTSWWSLVDLTPGRMIVLLYAVASSFGTFFLILPWSLNPGASIELIDAFFVAVSAIAVTGLTPVNVAETFSMAGQSVLLVMIQVGGLGIIAISAALAVITRNRLSLSHSMMGREMYDLPNVGRMGRFITRVSLFTVLIEALGALWIYTSLPKDLEGRAFHAIFQSVSAFCNAGFSSFPNNLEIPGLVQMKSVICLLVLLGGIGFPVIFELISVARPSRSYRKLSSNTVLTLLMAVGLLLIGATGIFFIELFAHPEKLLRFDDASAKIGHAIFYSVSSRTAGFNLSDVSTLSIGTQFFLGVLMIIGGAPLSTAGGIKTTTAGVIIVAAVSLLRGHKWIQFRNSEISHLVLQKAITIILLYFSALFVAVLALLALEPMDPWQITFEVISALSTVGLSLGITDQLGGMSKLIVIALMLTGRLGLVTMVYVGVGRVAEQRFHYAQEQYYVG